MVGGGVLGLTLALRLARRHQVDLLEAAPGLGGLACPHDYGAFVWDRFYHCILPGDSRLLGLLDELGLGGELRWRQTGTGYWAKGRFFDMNGTADYLRFPLLSWLDKARLGALTVYATRYADPYRLYGISAERWLTRICGRRAYRVFWQPLLKAKFGSYHDQVAASFIWATLTRLFGARQGVAHREQLGYVSGGYGRILERFQQRLGEAGARIRLSARVERIGPVERGDPQAGPSVPLLIDDAEGQHRQNYDQVFFTAPTKLAHKVVSDDLLPYVQRMEQDYPTGSTYLGVACLVLTLPRPLCPYYVLNIGDSSVQLTGLVEMTSLVHAQQETAGRALIYLPQYMASDDPRMDQSDEELMGPMIDHGLRRIFPDFRPQDAEYLAVHRARFVQPLPLVRHKVLRPAPLPALERPFQLLNTSLLTCATLNNDEVVGLVDRFLGPVLEGE